MASINKPDMILFLDDHRGQYIPRDFALSIDRACVDAKWHDKLDTLAKGPEGALDSEPDASDFYWDIWQELCDECVVTSLIDKVNYRIYQDGACWLVPEGMEWNEREKSFAWPSEDSEEESDEIEA